MHCRHISHRMTFSTLFVFLTLCVVGATTAKPIADPMPPDLLCKNTGGTWNGCGSGCGPATCANPVPGPICPAVCVDLCECPAASPLWDDSKGCVPHDTCGAVLGDGDGDGYTIADGDCDDSDSSISPGASEICEDGIDNDCTGLVDDGECADQATDEELCAISGGTWDKCSSYCSQATCESPELVECDALVCNPMCACPKETPLWDSFQGCIAEDQCDPGNPPPLDEDLDGFTVAQGDCDDYNAAIHPFATEECNEIDDNCDGLVDDGCQSTQEALCTSTGGEWAECGDLAGVPTCDDKDPASSDKIACLPSCGCPAEKPLWDDALGCISEDQCEVKEEDVDNDGFSANGGDCDDNDSAIFPEATETCDSKDNDCDGLVDEDGCESEEPEVVTLCKNTGGDWHECGDVCGTPTCAAPEPDMTQCAMAGCGPTCKCPAETPLWDAELGCVAADVCPDNGGGGEGEGEGNNGGVNPVGNNSTGGGDDGDDDKSGCQAGNTPNSGQFPLWVGIFIVGLWALRNKVRV